MLYFGLPNVLFTTKYKLRQIKCRGQGKELKI